MRSILKDHPSVKPKQWKLKEADRCDKCRVRAYVLIKGSTGELLFCNHHYEKIMNDPKSYNKMMAFMLEVVDERERLSKDKITETR